jgi:hypothetical protein
MSQVKFKAVSDELYYHHFDHDRYKVYPFIATAPGCFIACSRAG